MRGRPPGPQPFDQPSAAPPRTLVAVADDLYGVGLVRALRDEGIDVLTRVRSASTAAELVPELDLDVVLLELRQPRVGSAAVAHLREVDDPPSVLALSASPSDAEAVEALSAGASGYLSMDAHPTTLASAVRALRAGDVMVTGRVADGVLAPLRASSSNGLADEPLTTRELEVLARMTQGLGNEEIARELVVTASTVKNHVARIIAKLGVRNRTHAAVLAVHRRYV